MAKTMKVILHLAISADGFIAKTNGDSDWVAPADEILFTNRIQEAGCIVVGKKTFEQYQGAIYPVEGVFNIVLTRNQDATFRGATVATSAQEAIKRATNEGCSGVLIAGGGHTSAAFLEANLIDEIYFSVYPLIFGEGIKPFEGQPFNKKLELLGTKNLGDGLTELHYKVVK